jgi:hypothetical protein
MAGIWRGTFRNEWPRYSGHINACLQDKMFTSFSHRIKPICPYITKRQLHPGGTTAANSCCWRMNMAWSQAPRLMKRFPCELSPVYNSKAIFTLIPLLSAKQIHNCFTSTQTYLGLYKNNGAQIKLSLYMPWRPLGLREVGVPTISEAHRLWQGCQPYASAAFYSQKDSWYSFLLEAESNPGP